MGIGLVVISAAGYGSGSILAAPIYSTGVDWLTLVSWRFLIGAVLGWLWVLASSHRRAALRRLGRRQLAVALALGALFVGNSGTYYASLETVPAALAGVIVYTYPVMVAVLSLRFATRLPGKRPWIAAGLAVAGSALALGGIDVAEAPPVSGLVLVFASAMIYSVWIILSARLSGERRDRLGSESTADGSPAGDAAVTTTLMMSATAVVYAAGGFVAGRPLDPTTVPAERVAGDPGRRVRGVVPGDPDVLRRSPADRCGQGGADRDGRAVDHRRAGVDLPRPDAGTDPARRGGPDPRRGRRRADGPAPERGAGTGHAPGSRGRLIGVG